jgi:hypothetical protein
MKHFKKSEIINFDTSRIQNVPRTLSYVLRLRSRVLLGDEIARTSSWTNRVQAVT